MENFDALNAEAIRNQLNEHASCADIYVKESVTSTNTVLKELAEHGAAEGTVILAEQQSAGKGRLGRSFHSPGGTGLYMSILLRPKFSAEESLSITTAAAVAVAAAIEAVAKRRAMIKWVNDVYLDGYKVCGILTEASTDFEHGRLNYAILGIGVNVKEPPSGFSPDIKEIAGAVFKKSPPRGTRNLLAAEILNRFFCFYDSLTERTFMPEYKARSLLTGIKINFARGTEQYYGKVLDIDDVARLVVKLENGEIMAFSAGEITVEKNFLTQLRERKTGEVCL